MKVLCVLAFLAVSSSLVVSHKHKGKKASVVIIEKAPVVPVYQDYSYQRPHQSYETSYAQPYRQSYVQSYARPTYVQSYRQPYGQSYGGYGAYETLSFGKHKHHKHHHGKKQPTVIVVRSRPSYNYDYGYPHSYGRSYNYPVKGHKTKKQVVYRERIYAQPKVHKLVNQKPQKTKVVTKKIVKKVPVYVPVYRDRVQKVAVHHKVPYPVYVPQRVHHAPPPARVIYVQPPKKVYHHAPRVVVHHDVKTVPA
ncbi:putative cAMP-dependent protein kinase type II regulatory subunit [Ixodes scapularis]